MFSKTRVQEWAEVHQTREVLFLALQYSEGTTARIGKITVSTLDVTECQSLNRTREDHVCVTLLHLQREVLRIPR